VRFFGRRFDTDRYDLRYTVLFLPVVGKLLLKMLPQIDLICMDTASSTLPQCEVFDVADIGTVDAHREGHYVA
jgi:hypothetical protein